MRSEEIACIILGPPKIPPNAEDNVAPQIPAITKGEYHAIFNKKLVSLIRKSLFTKYAKLIASPIYTTKPTATALNVPNGIVFFGSFKSPDMATPAVKPVTAGKNIAKIISIDNPFPDGENNVDSGEMSVFVKKPIKIDTRDKPIAPRI